MRIKDIPFPILRELALENQKKQGNPKDDFINLANDRREGGFDWADTEPGRKFWSLINAEKYKEARKEYDWARSSEVYLRDNNQFFISDFKKGDLVYYRKKVGQFFDTIPCEVLQVNKKTLTLYDGDDLYLNVRVINVHLQNEQI